jgi:serine/threonine-protein kinase
MAVWRRDTRTLEETIERVKTVQPFPSLPMVQMLCSRLLAGTLDSEAFAPIMARNRAFFYQLRAEMEAHMGHTDQVLVYTEGAVQRGLYDLCWMDKCPLLDPIRGTPRFQELRAPVAKVAARTLIELRGSEATLAS